MKQMPVLAIKIISFFARLIAIKSEELSPEALKFAVSIYQREVCHLRVMISRVGLLAIVPLQPFPTTQTLNVVGHLRSFAVTSSHAVCCC
jgi:hypothetical protein